MKQLQQKNQLERAKEELKMRMQQERYTVARFSDQTARNERTESQFAMHDKEISGFWAESQEYSEEGKDEDADSDEDHSAYDD